MEGGCKRCFGNNGSKRTWSTIEVMVPNVPEVRFKVF